MDINTAINECVDVMADLNVKFTIKLDKDAWKKLLSNISEHLDQDILIEFLQAAKSERVWDKVEALQIAEYNRIPDSSFYLIPLPNHTARFLNKAADLKMLKVESGDDLAEIIFNTGKVTANHIADTKPVLDLINEYENRLINFVPGYVIRKR